MNLKPIYRSIDTYELFGDLHSDVSTPLTNSGKTIGELEKKRGLNFGEPEKNRLSLIKIGIPEEFIPVIQGRFDNEYRRKSEIKIDETSPVEYQIPQNQSPITRKRRRLNDRSLKPDMKKVSEAVDRLDKSKPKIPVKVDKIKLNKDLIKSSEFKVSEKILSSIHYPFMIFQGEEMKIYEFSEATDFQNPIFALGEYEDNIIDFALFNRALRIGSRINSASNTPTLLTIISSSRSPERYGSFFRFKKSESKEKESYNDPEIAPRIRNSLKAMDISFSFSSSINPFKNIKVYSFPLETLVSGIGSAIYYALNNPSNSYIDSETLFSSCSARSEIFQSRLFPIHAERMAKQIITANCENILR